MSDCCNGVGKCKAVEYLGESIEGGNEHITRWFIEYVSSILMNVAFDNIGEEGHGSTFKFSINFREEPPSADSYELIDIMKKEAYKMVEEFGIDMGDIHREFYVEMDKYRRLREG